MQSSTGQYSTHAGDPAHPVQHSVITASSFGFFLRGVVMPLERGSCFSPSDTIPAACAPSRSLAIFSTYTFAWIKGSVCLETATQYTTCSSPPGRTTTSCVLGRGFQTNGSFDPSESISGKDGK